MNITAIHDMVVRDSVNNLNVVVAKLRTLGFDEEANSLGRVAELVQVQFKCIGPDMKSTPAHPIQSLSFWKDAKSSYLLQETIRAFSDEVTKEIDADIVQQLLSLATRVAPVDISLSPLTFAPIDTSSKEIP